MGPREEGAGLRALPDDIVYSREQTTTNRAQRLRPPVLWEEVSSSGAEDLGIPRPLMTLCNPGADAGVRLRPARVPESSNSQPLAGVPQMHIG